MAVRGAAYAAMVSDVAVTGGYTVEDAQRYLVAVVATLEARFGAVELAELEAQLPPVLQEILHGETIDDLPGMDEKEFCAAVASRLQISGDEAEAISSVVLGAVRRRMTKEEAQYVEDQLPDDLKTLWRGELPPPS